MLKRKKVNRIGIILTIWGGGGDFLRPITIKLPMFWELNNDMTS